MTLEEYKKIDKNFNESIFLSKVNNIAIKYYSAIMMGNLDEIKHFLSDTVIGKATEVIKQASLINGRQMYDEINVKNSNIVSIEVKEDVYIIKVFLQLRYMDYIIDLSTSELIKGNNSFRIEVDRLFSFTKRINAKNQGTIRRCPGCGSSIDVNNFGICKYCGTSYNQEEYDWILNNIEIS